MKLSLETLPKNESLTLEYFFFRTQLGPLLIVTWKKNLVYVSFADNQKKALQEGKEYFREASWVEKENLLHRKVIRYLAQPKKFTGDFSLAVSGTPFQVAVWKALLALPFGETCFYSELAQKTGRVSAVRAAASAVAKNPIAIFIPCHRVLPKSGGVGKYHWGAKNKKALLVWERLAK